MSEPAAKPSRRPLWMIVTALLLGALALWGASRLTWFAEFRDGGVRGTVLYRETGEQQATALVPLALLALAGVAGVIATGGWARRVLGVVLALAGVAAVWTGIDGVRFGGYADGLPVSQMLIGRGLAALGEFSSPPAGWQPSRARARRRGWVPSTRLRRRGRRPAIRTPSCGKRCRRARTRRTPAAGIRSNARTRNRALQMRGLASFRREGEGFCERPCE